MLAQMKAARDKFSSIFKENGVFKVEGEEDSSGELVICALVIIISTCP